MKNAGKACNNRLYRHIRTFEKIVKNYFVICKKIHDQSTIWQVLHCAVTLTLRVERQHAFVLERAAIIRAAPQLVDMLRFGTIPLIGCVIAKLQRQNLTITVQRVVDPPALRPNRHGSLPAFSVINAAGGLWGQVRLPQRILADIAQKVVSA